MFKWFSDNIPPSVFWSAFFALLFGGAMHLAVLYSTNKVTLDFNNAAALYDVKCKEVRVPGEKATQQIIKCSFTIAQPLKAVKSAKLLEAR